MDQAAVNALHSLYQSRPDFIEFFQALRSRERNRSAITVENFLKAPEIDKSNYNGQTLARKVREFFNELENVGLGELIIGRRRAKTRFVLKVPLGEINKVIDMLDKREMPEASRSPESHPRRENELSTEHVSRMVIHKYILRHDCNITIDLPIDLTVNEAERLSGFIKTLPINSTK